jgi:DNA-binding transcriptional LysR family regulator
MSPPNPSLLALRAFEATARLRSMSAAADELSVTHGAISRHVRALEEVLGVPLLERGPHATRPTAEGTRLAEGLSTAFGLIQASLERVKPGPATISCSTSIMMYWLLPRIARFQQQHPQTELQFNMNYTEVDPIRDNISVAIRNTMIPAPQDVIVRRLADEWIGPVCSPEYLRATRLRKPADLARARLLATRTRPNAWSEWVTAAEVGDTLPAVAERFDHFYLLIQAAACGLGVATVPRMLVVDGLQSGRLVAPFGFVRGPHQLVLWLNPHVRARADVQALADWLGRELDESEPPTAQR